MLGSSLYGSPKSGLVLRLHESEGKETEARVETGFPIKEVARTDLLGRKQEGLIRSKSDLQVRLKPFEIATLRLVPDEFSRNP